MYDKMYLFRNKVHPLKKYQRTKKNMARTLKSPSFELMDILSSPSLRLAAGTVSNLLLSSINVRQFLSVSRQCISCDSTWSLACDTTEFSMTKRNMWSCLNNRPLTLNNCAYLYGMCYMTHKGTSHHLRETTHKLLRWHSL